MPVNWTRRSVLSGALGAAAGLLIPHRNAPALDKAEAFLNAPKQALVIGNSKYRHQLLKTVSNDARAMANALQGIGFETVVGLDWTRTEMDNAIRVFSEQLARRKAIGLLYFAGHAAQLAWRNYAVPVNAGIETIEELPSRCIEINAVVDDVRRAGNPLNIVILDACRDNPVGARVRPDQRGLSEIDAPPGTVLAYATLPGHTAIDGDEKLSLFTEHLLREIKVPEAKVEEVFKRVRMGVRRRSKGQQVPWESTSLDDDFWFQPPRVLKRLAEDEIERNFNDERVFWERAQRLNEPKTLEAYLMRYPSGRFSELAQAQLDRVLAHLGETKVEVVSSPQNPFSKGSARADTAYRIGDRYDYRSLDVLTRLLERERSYTVTEIAGDEVVFNKGGTVTDLLGNFRKWGGNIWEGSQTAPAEYSIGKRWSTRFRFIHSRGWAPVSLEMRVADRETIHVPAGSFNAFRVEGRGFAYYTPTSSAWIVNIWYAPDAVRLPVAWERISRDRWTFYSTTRLELVAFKQG